MKQLGTEFQVVSAAIKTRFWNLDVEVYVLKQLMAAVLFHFLRQICLELLHKVSLFEKTADIISRYRIKNTSTNPTQLKMQHSIYRNKEGF